MYSFIDLQVDCWCQCLRVDRGLVHPGGIATAITLTASGLYPGVWETDFPSFRPIKRKSDALRSTFFGGQLHGCRPNSQTRSPYLATWRLARSRRGAAKSRSLVVSVIGCLIVWIQIGIVISATAQESFPKAVKPFLDKHCVDCHDKESMKGGLDLSALSTDLKDPATFAQWVKAYDRVLAAEMPPKKKTQQPSDAERQQFTRVLSPALVGEERRRESVSGRTSLRRLNRTEYENSVSALVGVSVNVKRSLPPDTPLYGFDTVAEGLRFSQLQMAAYLEAADTALDQAIVLTEAPKEFKKRFTLKDEGEIRKSLESPKSFFRELPDGAVVVFHPEHSPTNLRIVSAPAAGDYRITVSAYGWMSHNEPVTLRIFAHNFREKRLIGIFEMPPDMPREATVIAHLDQGEMLQVLPHGCGFDSQGRNIWNVPGQNFEGSGLAVRWMEVEGPLGDWPPTSVKRVFMNVPVRELPKDKQPWVGGKRIAWELAPQDAAAGLRTVLGTFAARAFRRPLEPGEADPYIALSLKALSGGRTFEDSARVGLRAVLTSPQFLILDEHPGKLDNFSLASRLSYFLWSGPPDEPLLAAAADNSLGTPKGLRAQTERLLDDPRSHEFVGNFTGQWLDLRNIDATTPDKRLYPEFDETLQRSLVGETEAFFAEMLKHDLSVSNFIQSEFLMLNRSMAALYKIPGVTGEQFVPVSLPKDSPRGGLLTQAAILKVTANGTVTSPVRRGSWVMGRLLGEPPHPPPANVPAIEPDTRGATTVREQLAKHRNAETCANCHKNIDPPGFALENFDVIGGWRDRYRSLEQGDQVPWKFEGRDIWEFKLAKPVDASGELPDGQSFKDIRELKNLLLGSQVAVLRCVAEKMLTYATGAGIRFSDRPEVDHIVLQTSNSGGGLRTLVHEIVQSPVFQSK